MGFSPKYDYLLGEEEAHGAEIGGSGSAQTLPMTEEEMAAVVKRPIGFVLPDDKPAKKPRSKKGKD